MVYFSSNFIKKTVLWGATFDSILKEIKIYANRKSFDVDETIYYFVLKLLNEDLFFSIEEENDAKELLYLAIFWASKTEYKNSTRKEHAKDIKISPRGINIYTQMQSKVIKSIYDNFNGYERDEKVELYMRIFFECNCVQRNKKTKKK